MDRVRELEDAIESLPPDEFSRLAQWIRERDHDLWDRQLDADSAAGKLDFLFEEAEPAAGSSSLHEWPSSN